MAETAYDPYAQSDIGSRALGGEYIDSMNFYWFDPVTETTGSTTEGWSRVPDSVKPYTYINPTNRNNAKNKFYEMGGSYGSSLGSEGGAGGGILSGLDFARSIAGGQNIPNMISPGVSYSQERPGGYTQDDLNYENRFYSEGPVPVRPDLPPTGNDYTQIPNQMPYAPPGVTVEKFVQPEIRPQTISPLGSLDTTYLNDIDFSGLLGTPSPQVDFPIAPPEVIASAIANQPVYQDPIMSMVEPVTNNNVATPNLMPLIDLGLLNEPMAIPQNNTPFTPLNIFDAPINFDAIRTYGR